MSLLKRVALGFTLLLLVLIGIVAYKLRSRAETIPDELPAIDTALHDPANLLIPAQGGLPDFTLAAHRGKTLYVVVEDRESISSRESMSLQRALNRWTYPPDVVGVQIGDVDGFALLQSKIEEFVALMRVEMRIPLYMDYQGAFIKTFKLPRGHVGVVVFGPDSQVLLRHSGPADDKFLAELRTALRASEPTPPPAPAFKIDAVDNAACKGKACLLVFLDEPVKRTDIPGVKNGFDSDDVTAAGIQGRKPSVRLSGLAVAADEKLDASKALAVLVGTTEGLDLKHWTAAPDAPDARAALGFDTKKAGFALIDPEGNLAMLEYGAPPYYKFGRVSDLIGVDLGDHTEP